VLIPCASLVHPLYTLGTPLVHAIPPLRPQRRLRQAAGLGLASTMALVSLSTAFPTIHLLPHLAKDARTGPEVTALVNVQPSPVISVCGWAGHRPAGPGRRRRPLIPPAERLIIAPDTAKA
jgi:hypothetical protein